MYLKKIEINHFRNFNKTTIEFQDGINIIIGPNNSGKTNLLKAINLLENSSRICDIHDFNKNDIVNNLEMYKNEPPVIEMIYYIDHIIDLNSNDDGILRLKDFIVYNETGEILSDSKDDEYVINAAIRLRYELDVKYLSEYKEKMIDVKDVGEFFGILEKIIQQFSWNYYNVSSNQNVKRNKDIFNIDLIEADRRTNEILPKTKDYVKEQIENNGNKVELKNKISSMINSELSGIAKDIKSSLDDDQDIIGIKNGNNEIFPCFIYNSSFYEYFDFELKDINLGYEIPMGNNGLGYNNLVQICNIINFKINNIIIFYLLKSQKHICILLCNINFLDI